MSATNKLRDRIDRKTQMVLGQARIKANPEGVRRYEIGIGQIAHHAVRTALHIGLAEQVAAKQQPGADAVLVEMPGQLIAREMRTGANRNRIAEP